MSSLFEVYFGSGSQCGCYYKKSHLVLKSAVAEMCQGQRCWLPTHNNHPIGQAAPPPSPSSSIVISQCAFAQRHRGPMAGTDVFSEKCHCPVFWVSLVVQSLGNEANVQIWDNNMCSIHLSALLWFTVVPKPSILHFSAMMSPGPNPWTCEYLFVPNSNATSCERFQDHHYQPELA
jgi:hypothetical protein